MQIKPASGKLRGSDEIRVSIEGFYGKGDIRHSLPDQPLYVSAKGECVKYTFKPNTENASEEERRQGMTEQTLTIKAVCQERGKIYRKTQTCKFAVKLNSDKIIRRVPARLGNILGLTPRSMR